MAITKIPEGLKVNKFKMTLIPSNSQLYRTYGPHACGPSDYTGDDKAPRAMDKVHTLQSASRQIEKESSNN